MPNEARVKQILRTRKFGNSDIDTIEKHWEFFEAPSFSETADSAPWLLNVTDGGADDGEVVSVADDEHGGALRMVTNDADDDALTLQLNGEQVRLSDNRNITFIARMKVDDVSTADFAIGLSIALSSGTNHVLGGVSDALGFRMEADGNIDFWTEKDSTESSSDSGEDLSDDTYVKLQATIRGTDGVDFYVNDTLVGTSSTNIPDDEALAPFIEVRNASAATSEINVDYVHIGMER